MTAEDWNCTKCTALNEPTSPTCWNCKTPLAMQTLEASEREKKAILAALEKQADAQHKKDQLNVARSSGRASIADLLRVHIGRPVGINARNPAQIDAAILVDVQSDFFTVQVDELEYHLPYTSVLRVIGAKEDAVSVGTILKSNYQLVITVFDLVIYKGFVGVGLSIPL